LLVDPPHQFYLVVSLRDILLIYANPIDTKGGTSKSRPPLDRH